MVHGRSLRSHLALSCQILCSRMEGMGEGDPPGDEEVKNSFLRESGISLYIGEQRNVGENGQMIVSATRLIWSKSDNADARVLALNVKDIAIHAIARGAGCILCQALGEPPTASGGFDQCLKEQKKNGDQSDTNGHENWGCAAHDGQQDEDDENDEEETSEQSFELRIVPSDASRLKAIYDAITSAAEINPDSGDEDNDDDEYEEGGNDNDDDNDGVPDWDSKLVDNVQQLSGTAPRRSQTDNECS